ncbi:MAG: zinc dependent phospholipase C family protein, partial [Leadbetterella sp.]|nr:zinc dependent phospholipase C family protein [Leadbetterella sp.]
MPATFAHCLIARKAITQMGADKAPYSGILKIKNNYVVMGATGPDYPYLTDVIKYGVLHIGHNWANRMHYENVEQFIKEGIRKLSLMDKKGDQFLTCLSWFAGYVSHVIVDSFVHPVINCIVNGIYIFTNVEHTHCELIQDVYIFKKLTSVDIIKAAPRDNGTFGYL